MSVHPISIPADATLQGAADVTYRVSLLCEARLRRCSVDWDTPAIMFDPDLSPEETVQFDQPVRVASSPIGITPSEYAAVRTQMQTLRDLRQMGRNAFMALTAAERDRLMYDAFTATTQVLLSILRDDQ